jgi:hypothetical protein
MRLAAFFHQQSVANQARPCQAAKPGEMTPAGKDCKRILMINGSCHGGATTEMLPTLLSLRLHGIASALVAW